MQTISEALIESVANSLTKTSEGFYFFIKLKATMEKMNSFTSIIQRFYLYFTLFPIVSRTLCLELVSEHLFFRKPELA